MRGALRGISLAAAGGNSRIAVLVCGGSYFIFCQTTEQIYQAYVKLLLLHVSKHRLRNLQLFETNRCIAGFVGWCDGATYHVTRGLHVKHVESVSMPRNLDFDMV